MSYKFNNGSYSSKINNKCMVDVLANDVLRNIYNLKRGKNEVMDRYVDE